MSIHTLTNDKAEGAMRQNNAQSPFTAFGFMKTQIGVFLTEPARSLGGEGVNKIFSIHTVIYQILFLI